MKKILFAAVALVAMASCATDEVVMRPENKLAIEFDNAFVENSTRAADIYASNLADFGVYGSIENANGTALTFNNTKVYKDGDVYKYSPAQVWANNATFTFAAFAPFTDRQWSYAVTNKQAYNGVITFNNAAAEANQDLLFASEDRTTGVIDSKPEAVALTFNHMLSRVKFHFTNNFHEGSNVDLKVTNVTITDAHSTGTLAVNGGQVGNWEVGTATFSRNFGDVKTPHNNTTLDENGGNGETEHFYLIPTEGEFNVTFNVRMTYAKDTYDDFTHNAVLKINMEKGHSYVVRTALNQTNTDPKGEMYAIEFVVEKVEKWENFEDVALEAKTVATAQELADAVTEGGNVRLTENITLSSDELLVDENNSVNLDLNGYTLTVSALDPIKNNGKMTIANGKVVANNGENTRRCIYNYGEMTINGVEFVQTYDKKGAAINNEGKMIINGATVNAVFYSIWNSGANAELIINGGTYTTTNNVALRDIWAYAVTCRAGAKMTINGGSFVGNHGVIAAEGGEVVLNGGTYHCTATYTGNSDWTLYAADGGSIRYNAAACTVTSDNPSGATYGNVTTF